jgi:hypothetical protein
MARINGTDSKVFKEVRRMNTSDKIKVKEAATVDFVHRGRKGSVIGDAALGKPIEVELDDESVPHTLNETDLEAI